MWPQGDSMKLFSITGQLYKKGGHTIFPATVRLNWTSFNPLSYLILFDVICSKLFISEFSTLCEMCSSGIRWKESCQLGMFSLFYVWPTCLFPHSSLKVSVRVSSHMYEWSWDAAFLSLKCWFFFFFFEEDFKLGLWLCVSVRRRLVWSVWCHSII